MLEVSSAANGRSSGRAENFNDAAETPNMLLDVCTQQCVPPATFSKAGQSQSLYLMQLDDGPLEEQEIAFILQQVLRALVYVHTQQRVHRDIKAANVLLSVAGAVKISDFGVSGQMTGTILLSVCIGLRSEYPAATASP